MVNNEHTDVITEQRPNEIPQSRLITPDPIMPCVQYDMPLNPERQVVQQPTPMNNIVSQEGAPEQRAPIQVRETLVPTVIVLHEQPRTDASISTEPRDMGLQSPNSQLNMYRHVLGPITRSMTQGVNGQQGNQ